MRISHHVPVDRIAAMVTSKGKDYKSNVKIANFNSDVLPTIRPITKVDLENKSFVNLTMVKFGRLTVIGLTPLFKGRWVVRCSCGKYEVRTKKAIMNTENYGDRCRYCRHLSYLRRKDEYRQYGENLKDSRDY